MDEQSGDQLPGKRSGSLTVSFIDELYVVEPDERLSFGRDADIVIDESNQFMHRRVGRFLNHNGLWWLRNEGRTVELTTVVGQGKLAILPPGESVALTEQGLVRFEAGAYNYELEFTLTAPIELPVTATAPNLNVARTADFGLVRLNEEQRLLLAALCETRLRDPAADRLDLPANSDIAHRLGWSIKKFDRKLDYLCVRLSEMGVLGLRGGKGVEATLRRANLADHVLRHGLITSTDLAALEAHVATDG